MHPDEMPVAQDKDRSANWPEFQRELAALINRHSLENFSNTPDHVLAEYLTQCLVAYNISVSARDHLAGRANVADLKTGS